LSKDAQACFSALPLGIQEQLLLDRDPHGNVQVSKIETERLLIQSVDLELRHRRASNAYGGRFSAQPLFLGYEGRSCLPSNFDAQYCYALGTVAAALLRGGATGVMASVKYLLAPVVDWQPAGIPISALLHLEERHGKEKPVIRKALVELEGPVFAAFKEARQRWAREDAYRYPGAIQFAGNPKLSDARTETLRLEQTQPVLQA
jgi:pyrophosphate--fructose-6-phosphate 1-phosphotransferase